MNRRGTLATQVRPWFEAFLVLAKHIKPTSWEDGEFCQLALKLGVRFPQERYYPHVLAWIERQAPLVRNQEIIPGDVINRLYEVFRTILAECPNVQSAFLLRPIITAIYPHLWESGRFAQRAWETLQVHE